MGGSALLYQIHGGIPRFIIGAMDTLVDKLLRKNRELYDQAAEPLRSHGPDHHKRVYDYAVVLAGKVGVKYDDEILAGAALLHDLAAYYPKEVGDAYHDHDHVIAEKALRDIGYPEQKIAAACEAIASHGSDPKYQLANESIETKLLRDADKLDVFGPLGVARVVMVRTLKGDTLEQIVDDFWTHGHLKRKWDSISFEEARTMAASDYEYSRIFFERLATDLGV